MCSSLLLRSLSSILIGYGDGFAVISLPDNSIRQAQKLSQRWHCPEFRRCTVAGQGRRSYMCSMHCRRYRRDRHNHIHPTMHVDRSRRQPSDSAQRQYQWCTSWPPWSLPACHCWFPYRYRYRLPHHSQRSDSCLRQRLSLPSRSKQDRYPPSRCECAAMKMLHAHDVAIDGIRSALIQFDDFGRLCELHNDYLLNYARVASATNGDCVLVPLNGVSGAFQAGCPSTR